MTGPLFLGVDGGGTGCRARVEDAEGTILGSGIAGPATTRLGIEQAMASVETACRAALDEAGIAFEAAAHVHCGVGLAGMGRKGAQEAFEALPHPFASIAFATDGLVACIGAHSGADGGIVIVGTGSFGLARVEGREIRVGGYGFPISDEGSGADLGLQAIRLALRALDGRIDRTPLLTSVLARFKDDPFEAVAWMDRASATDYATFAPLVMRHADDGDPVGRRIVQGSAEQIDGLVRALVERGAPRISLIGGLSSAIEPWLAPDVRRRLKPLDGDAVSGAIRLAREVARV
ncbi:N-acetylglucosamine kinase [uncultured Alsobacter sp.]|uniref:N-acetylglucosamine kinase n=1 Tax=uncultured Alsobacter sp. TaxID=1748258 RepID=UPI0025EFD261|nr:N-acetylglucosamine kinase [uncultured Alsobacter sp.]